MIPASCKRLIEVDFPIGVVSEHSAREKGIRHGHPSTMHLWWARRPLAACRSVLMGLLLPDPCDKDCPPDFKYQARALLANRYTFAKNSDDSELRELLLQFIGELANWDNASNSFYLEIARGLVRVAHPEETPVVVDPFSGGGAIPLEALRLGCEAFASDLNPVACLILKTLLEDIPKFGSADFTLTDENDKDVVVHGLANAIRHLGAQVKRAADKELAEFYPIDPDGARPIAYLWARTVRCEGIGCGAEIPLVRSFWLCKKGERRQALRYRIDRPVGEPPQVVFEIYKPNSEDDTPSPTVSRANATCPCCRAVLPAPRVRAQLSDQNGGADVCFDKNGNRIGGALLLAVVTLRDGVSGRHFRLPTRNDYSCIFHTLQRLAQLPAECIPHEPTPVGGGSGAGRAFCFQNYGMRTFADLFTSRQKLALAIIAQQIKLVGREKILTLALGKLVDLANCICRWEPIAECPRNVFAAGRVKPAWDFAEGNPIAESSGSFAVCVDNLAQGVESVGVIPRCGTCETAMAQASPMPDASVDCWFTDPPYYDAYPYADLSDVFFVWIKRALQKEVLFRDPFDLANPLSPKESEITQDESRQWKGSDKNKAFFEQQMGLAFAEGARLLRTQGIGCVVFAHKTTEGWEALITGIISGGLAITASWPIATEQAHRLRAKESAALATSVHLVCRPRSVDAGIGDWSKVKAAMEKRIREWLPTLSKHGVRGADAVFSCLGPALESYSRYDKVLTAADHEVPLGGDPEASEPHKRGFLAYVFETVSKEALRQVLGDAETEGFEEDSRMTALFLWTLQGSKTEGKKVSSDEAESDDDEVSDIADDAAKPKKTKAGFAMPFDTFIRITRPMGIHYPSLEGRVIEIEKGIVRLLPVRERSEQLLGEVATRPDIDISLKDIRQMELALGLERQASATQLPTGRKKGGKKAATTVGGTEIPFTTLDRIHRAMLLFTLGRSVLLRQVLEEDMRQGKDFERLALALNALYPDGCDERRMLEGVQAAMRGVK